MINAIGIDDEPPALKILENFCEQTEFVTLHKTFTGTTEALKYIQKFPVDLLFLDINMPALSGLDFYKSIPDTIMVVFTTAYSEYAVEGFNLSAIDYLLKPFSFGRFTQAMKKAREYYNYKKKTGKSEERFIFVRADYSLLKVQMDEISAIEALGDYLKIHLQNQKPVITRMTMKRIHSKLPETEFMRVHRSFIIPLNKIESVKNKLIAIEGMSIPIGAIYEEDFFNRFSV